MGALATGWNPGRFINSPGAYSSRTAGSTAKPWFHGTVRAWGTCVLALTLCVACGQPTAPQTAPLDGSSTSTHEAGPVNPARVARTRSSLPPGYEVSALPPVATPMALWGIGEYPASAPVDCARSLTTADGPVSGWSASGPGGIVHVGVAGSVGSVGRPPTPEGCTPWTVTTDRTQGVVTFTGSPELADGATVGLVTDMRTVVEGGTETDSRAESVVAYLGAPVAHLAYVVVVTDPGASGPALEPGFAARLLTETVAAIRGE